MKFSVLMSVYFKEDPQNLKKALESVFEQTVKPNEVVLVEDGKLTKELYKVIEDFKQKYKKVFKIVSLKENKGLGIALNEGLKECSYDLVARMDTDDECIKDRFEKQINKFIQNPEIDVLGGNIVEYDDKLENVVSHRIVPETQEEIAKYIKKRNPFNHVTVMFKKAKILEVGGYKDCHYFEDYYLWCRLHANKAHFYNIQESFVKVRGGTEMIIRRGGRKYITDIINFENKIKKLKIINHYEYIFNVLTRSIVAIVPNKIRTKIYEKKLRVN